MVVSGLVVSRIVALLVVALVVAGVVACAGLHRSAGIVARVLVLVGRARLSGRLRPRPRASLRPRLRPSRRPCRLDRRRRLPARPARRGCRARPGRRRAPAPPARRPRPTERLRSARQLDCSWRRPPGEVRREPLDSSALGVSAGAITFVGQSRAPVAGEPVLRLAGPAFAAFALVLVVLVALVGRKTALTLSAARLARVGSVGVRLLRVAVGQHAVGTRPGRAESCRRRRRVPPGRRGIGTGGGRASVLGANGCGTPSPEPVAGSPPVASGASLSASDVAARGQSLSSSIKPPTSRRVPSAAVARSVATDCSPKRSGLEPQSGAATFETNDAGRPIAASAQTGTRAAAAIPEAMPLRLLEIEPARGWWRELVRRMSGFRVGWPRPGHGHPTKRRAGSGPRRPSERG